MRHTTHFLCVLAFTVAIEAMAQDSETVFIPRSALTESEREEALDRLLRDFDDMDLETAEIIVSRGSLSYRYRDVDVRRVFPELSDDDYQASVCTNTIMSGATSINYHSVIGANRMAIKAAPCVEREDGLYCGALDIEELYYFETPDVHFRLYGEIDYEQATEILTAFRSGGVVGFDEWHQKMYEHGDILSIRRVDDAFELTLGEFLCKGCQTRAVVNLVQGQGDVAGLELVRIEQSMCI